MFSQIPLMALVFWGHHAFYFLGHLDAPKRIWQSVEATIINQDLNHVACAAQFLA